MGLFERAGREVERFKQTARAEAERTGDYRCRECGERFRADHDECPECGAEAVVATADGAE